MFFKTKSSIIVFYSREGCFQAGYDIRTKIIVDLLRKSKYNCEVISLKNFIPEVEESHISYIYKIFLNFKAFILLVKFRPKIIFLQRVNYHVIAFLLYILIFKTKKIIDIDDWEFKENLNKKFFFFSNSISETLSRILCKYSDYTIVSSDYLKNYFSVYAKRIIKIPSTVLKMQINIPNWQNKVFNCVWVGSLDDSRIEILEEIKSLISCFMKYAKECLHLTLIVKGNLANYLDYYVKNIQTNRVSLRINLDQREITQIFKESHFGVVPLFQKNKFFVSKSPVKLFEYMRSGLIPVASNNCEAINIIKQNETGFLVPNIHEMIDILNDLSNRDIKELNLLSKTIKNNFDVEWSLENHIESWKKVVRNFIY